MERFLYPPEWKETAEKILLSGKIVLVLGAVDTGKTTLVTFLANYSLGRKEKIVVVDADIGQSDIGPPATIGLGWVTKEISHLNEIPLDKMYFVGAISPEKNLLPTVVGTKIMVEKALEQGADLIIIDTTGLVNGEIGRILKRYKIELIHPDHLLALQRTDELEPVLRSFIHSGIFIHRLPLSSETRSKSLNERRALRDKRIQSFFLPSRIQELPWENFSTSRFLFRAGKELSNRERETLSRLLEDIVIYAERLGNEMLVVTPDLLDERALLNLKRSTGIGNIVNCLPEHFSQLLVGLADEHHEVLSLGVIKEIDFVRRVVRLLTPWEKPNLVKHIQFSRFKVDLSPFLPHFSFPERGKT